MHSSTVHEIRNQLAVAVANIEAFIDGKLKATPDRLNAVLQALLEVDVLVDELRGVSATGGSPRLESVDVCHVLLNELIGIEAAAAAAGIELSVARCTAKHPECVSFVCDPGQVGQIIKNVLLNAVRYTPRGGVIAVDCHREPGVLAVAVSDRGPGVRPEERATIFEPGIRGSAASGLPGSGLGLTVVKRLVGAHGGSVIVDRGELGGARFSVRLPGTFTAPPDCASCAPLV